jgi:hypothetical protein
MGTFDVAVVLAMMNLQKSKHATAYGVHLLTKFIENL